MTSGDWMARYPDLAGKVALVTGDHPGVVAIAATLAANGAPLGVITSERATVDAALAAAESTNAMGVVGDPGDPATWERVVPHAEQRLGPLDIVVAFDSPAQRQAVISATLPDMAARRRGVVIEVGAEVGSVVTHDGVRRRFVQTDGDSTAADIAAAVALCASDVLVAPEVTIRLVP